jgi:hypothetical protein
MLRKSRAMNTGARLSGRHVRPRTPAWWREVPMWRVNDLPLVLVIALAVTAPATTSAQVPPDGPDFEVAYTDYHVGGTVAVDEEGQLLAAWLENFGSVRACGFDRHGVLQGCLSLDSPWYLSTSPVHAAACGVDDFVVVWEGYDSGAGKTLIRGRYVTVNGTPLTPAFEVYGTTTGGPMLPRVALHPANALVVVWADDTSDGTDTSGLSIQARFLGTDGSPLGDRFQVNTTTLGDQTSPEVATAPDGRFVIVWQSESSSGGDVSGWSVQAQRFNAGGDCLGSELQVNAYTDNHQSEPAVAVHDDGSFVVVWESLGSSGLDHDGWSIQSRRVSADGTPLGNDIEVNTYIAGDQVGPSIGMLAGESCEVVWSSEGSFGDDDDGWSVQRQAFAADGSPSGGQLQVNTTIAGGQYYAELSMNRDGDFAAIWTHGGLSIRGRTFRSTLFSDGFELGNPNAWSLVEP